LYSMLPITSKLVFGFGNIAADVVYVCKTVC